MFLYDVHDGSRDEQNADKAVVAYAGYWDTYI